ncbi:MAG: TIGR01777 family oxidoreductase [Armatimonas sp.]
MRLVLCGGSGFCGQLLKAFFTERGWEVIVVSRNSGGWERLRDTLNGADAVVNLAGRTVNCRYTPDHCAEIYASRLDTTRAIGEAIAACSNPTLVWLNASTATIYRHALDRDMDEATEELGKGFSVDVARYWEQTLWDSPTPHTRKVALRSAMVMAPGAEGIFGAFYGLVKAGLGGPMAGGAQYISWIHGRDFCRSVEFLIEHSEISGPVNLAAPHPLPNREFLGILRKAIGMPLGLPSTRWMLEIGAWLRKTETELLLKSRRVVPGMLLAAGFEFRYPTWPEAVKDLVETK